MAESAYHELADSVPNPTESATILFMADSTYFSGFQNWPEIIFQEKIYQKITESAPSAV